MRLVRLAKSQQSREAEHLTGARRQGARPRAPVTPVRGLRRSTVTSATITRRDLIARMLVTIAGRTGLGDDRAVTRKHLRSFDKVAIIVASRAVAEVHAGDQVNGRKGRR